MFFFQAEDGIRDWSVTGVQTCALPISRIPPEIARAIERALNPTPEGRFPTVGDFAATLGTAAPRSEERRVGKECRCRWLSDQPEKKNTSPLCGGRVACPAVRVDSSCEA